MTSAEKHAATAKLFAQARSVSAEDATLANHINTIADHVAAELEAEIPDGLGDGPGQFGTVRRNKSLANQAAVVEHMQAIGFSKTVSDRALMAARAIHHARKATLNGPIALTKAPDIKEGEARIKSDGKGAIQLYQTAARNGSVNRQRDTQAAVYLNRGTQKGKAIERRFAEVRTTFTPLEDDHGAKGKDIDDEWF